MDREFHPEPVADRRQGDRRKADLPFPGEDRRKGDRRSGLDRRAAPRMKA